MLLAFFRIPDYYPCKSKWLFAIYAHYCALHDSKQYVLYRLFSALPLFFYLGWFIIRIFCIPVWIQPSKTENQVNDLRDGIAGILLFSSSIVFKENRNSVENIQMPKKRQKRTSCNSDELLCKKSLEEMSKKVSFEIFQNLLVIFSKDYNYGVHEVWARWKIKIAIKMVSKINYEHELFILATKIRGRNKPLT